MAAKAVETELPPLFPRHVRRPRLTSILDASTAQAALIIAPAGYGKTTLVAEWLQGKDIGVWYRATNASADVAAFSAELVEVIQPFFPGAGETVLQRLRVPEAPGRIARILAELLAEDIEEWPPDKIVVVDDYHLMAESAAVEEFVDWLLTLSPIRVVVTSRTRPRWASARRLLYGEVLVLNRDQLAMTAEEAHRVIGTAETSRATSIIRGAEGWPALVRLASLSDSPQAPISDVSDALYRYFAEEILRHETALRQTVLLQLAVLPQLIPEYLEVLDLPSETVAHLLAEQPLIPPDEDGARRLHPLLKTFLLQRFRESDPDGYVSLHVELMSRARKLRRWSDSFELALQVGDHHMAATVACEAGPELLTSGRHETLSKWLSACGPVVGTHPEALLLQAETLLRQGEVAEAYGSACQVPSLTDDSAMRSKAWRLRGRASYWLGQNDRALREHKEAMALAVDRVETQQALWGAYLASQQLREPEAPAYLDQLENLEPLDAETRLRLAVGRCVSSARAGSYRETHDLMEANAGYLGRTSDPEAKSSFLAHWGYIEVNRAEYERGQLLGGEAAEFARNLRLGLPLHSCLTCQALAQIGMRRFAQAARVHSEMRLVEDEVPDPSLRLQTRIVELKLRLARGTRFSESHYRVVPDVRDPTAAELLSLQALVAATRADAPAVKKLIQQARSLSDSAESTLYADFALLTLELSVLPPREAQRRLLNSASSAFERDCPDAYVVAYRAAPSLLGVAASVPELEEPTNRVLGLARDQRLGAKFGFFAPARQPLDELLTRRELEVFGLMAQGLSNREIANHIVVSDSTVKVHVHNILRKLGARNRMDAILRYGTERP